MHPWSLDFTDAELERCYRVQRFRGSYAIFLGVVAIFMVSILALGLAHTPLAVPCYVTTAGSAALLSFRVWLHHCMHDQERACVLFGRIMIGLTAVGWAILNSNERPHATVGAFHGLLLQEPRARAD